MQLVIKIDKEYKDYFIEKYPNTIMTEAIQNGVELPKEHGDLIDKEKFKEWIETQDGDKLMTEYYLDALDMQEPIVGGSLDGNID